MYMYIVYILCVKDAIYSMLRLTWRIRCKKPAKIIKKGKTAKGKRRVSLASVMMICI